MLCNNYVGEVGFYLKIRKHPAEYLSWLQTGVEAAKAIKERKVENNHLGNIGNCYYHMGEIEQAILTYEECLQNYQDMGDLLGEARTLSSQSL